MPISDPNKDRIRHVMTRRQVLAGSAGMAVSASLAQGASNARPVKLHAADGAIVYGWFTPAKTSAKPVILLFHQAGSNHAEYLPIVPHLIEEGFACLALDQRSGGNMWGMPNRAAKNANSNYPAVLPDLQAALAWPKTQGYPAKSVIWGSSYSAALVFLLAANQPESVAAVLAFSPGEYLGAGHPIAGAAAKIHVPVFITSAIQPDEVAAAGTIAKAVPPGYATHFVPRKGGVHGSSTLRPDRNPAGMEENWQAVDRFLGALQS